MTYKKILISIIVILSYCGAYAQIVTDRPDQTESSSTVHAGALQIESGVLVGDEWSNNTSNRQVLLPTNLFRYGITRVVELRVLNQYEINKSNSNEQFQGFSDIEVGTKIQILKREHINTEIAVLSHLVFPTGSYEIGNEKYGTINKLSISHSLNENLNLGYNIGYNHFGAGVGDLTYSMSLAVGVNNRVGLYIEPFGEFSDLEQFMLNVDGGFTYLITPNFQLDYSFGTGVNNNMNYMSLGGSWLFEK